MQPMDLVAGITAVPLVIALVELVKRIFAWDGNKNDRYGLAAAVIIGMALSAAYNVQDVSSFVQWRDAIVYGLAVGLSASGLYAGAKRALNPED